MTHLTQWWNRIEADYQELLKLPFNQELAWGSLSREAFRFYLAQDSIYIAQYARALALLSAKAPSSGLLYKFIEFAQEGVEIDKALHAEFIETWQIKPAKETALATEAYSNFLLTKAALGSFAEGLAALLPCFWIYAKVGQDIAKIAVRPNPYAQWIDTYAGEAFDQTTQKLMNYTEHAISEAGEPERQRMFQAFRRSVHYEWYFWNNAYHRRMW